MSSSQIQPEMKKKHNYLMNDELIVCQNFKLYDVSVTLMECHQSHTNFEYSINLPHLVVEWVKTSLYLIVLRVFY